MAECVFFEQMAANSVYREFKEASVYNGLCEVEGVWRGWRVGGWVMWTWVRCWCVGMCGGRGVCNEQAVPPEASA